MPLQIFSRQTLRGYYTIIDSATWGDKENYNPPNPLHYFGLIYIQSDSLLYKLEFEYLYENYLMKYSNELQKCFFVFTNSI